MLTLDLKSLNRRRCNAAPPDAGDNWTAVKIAQTDIIIPATSVASYSGPLTIGSFKVHKVISFFL